VAREVFGVSDPKTLITALLHDTVEDTTTDFDDLEEKFGADVAGWVGMLSKDKRLPEPEREQAYVAQLARAPWQVKLCKLADVFDNLMDPIRTPAQAGKAFKNAHRYLDALRHGLPDEARRPWQVVSDLLAELESRKTERAGGA
jgi:guanosine-3',5'-bis(diphosphate) 3'-pyrophosphohydrolase